MDLIESLQLVLYKRESRKNTNVAYQYLTDFAIRGTRLLLRYVHQVMGSVFITDVVTFFTLGKMLKRSK